MPASNRDRILEGAIRCIQTQGVANTTTRDIAAAAGASLGSIPYHFGTKDALLDEALRLAMLRYNDSVRREILAVGDPDSRDVMTNALRVLLSTFGDHEALLVSLFETYGRAMHVADLRAGVAQHRRIVMAGLAQTIRPHLPDAQASGDTADMVALLFLSLIDGLMLHWLMDPDAMPSATRITTALEEIVGSWTSG